MVKNCHLVIKNHPIPKYVIFLFPDSKDFGLKKTYFQVKMFVVDTLLLWKYVLFRRYTSFVYAVCFKVG